MFRFFSFVVCLFISVGLPFASYAASVEEEDIYVNEREVMRWLDAAEDATKGYARHIGQIKQGQGDLYNHMYALRAYYSKSAQYDPFAKTTLKKMEHYAYVMDTSADLREANEAAIEYRKLLDMHLVNWDVLEYAILMSSLDVRYGSERFLKSVQYTLKRILDIPRLDGLSPGAAFPIVSYGEETYLIQKHGGVVQKSELFEVTKKYYNVHDVVTKSGDYIQVYINVTTPIRQLQIKRAAHRTERVIRLPGQQ
ncbi:MAG: hypothetical protein ACRBDL_11735 [Alphaproteobacteria bacterium]